MNKNTENFSKTSTAVRNAGKQADKFLTFYLATEEYGIEILKVHEIIGAMQITPIPNAPSYLCGVINLRGRIIPIIDIRVKFCMPPSEKTDETCIIVVNVDGLQTGIVVDRVSEVLKIEEENIAPLPAFGTEVDIDCLSGIGKSEGHVTLLLNIEKILPSGDVYDINETE